MLGKLPSLKERPVLNTMYMSSKNLPAPRQLNLKSLIYWVKRTPECIGILKRLATDIVTEIYFTSVAEQKTGRPSDKFQEKIEGRAVYFAKNNSLRQKLIAAVIDYLITGDFYLWMGKISEGQIKEVADRHLKSYGIETKEINYKQFFDEDFNGINQIEVVPSSMMLIHQDQDKIISYVQKSKSSSSKDRTFVPDEIIHGKFMEIDGGVYGFSPMEAGYTAIRTINAIQDYNFYYFDNGAKIDRAWYFQGNPNQAYINKFKESLRQYIGVKRAHGSLVLTGADKISSEKLNDVSEEMEFRQLAIHQVGRLAFAFNMPADILSSVLGVDIKGTAMGSDIEDAGYNRNIEKEQLKIEEYLNTQLFLPEFKVAIHFKKYFKQDQIRQVQYLAQTIPVLEFFFKHEIPVKEEYYYDILQIDRKYLTGGKIKKEIEIAQPFVNPGQKPVNPNTNQQKFKDAKTAQQKPQQNINPPTGS